MTSNSMISSRGTARALERYRIQQDSRASVSHPEGGEASWPGDNQFAASSGASARLRSCRCRIAESRPSRRYSLCQGSKRLGVRFGDWLSGGQAKDLLRCPNGEPLIGKRDHAILALVLGCGLGRSEAAQLTLEHFQRRTITGPSWICSAKVAIFDPCPFRTG